MKTEAVKRNLTTIPTLKKILANKPRSHIHELWAVRIPRFLIEDKRLKYTDVFLMATMLSFTDAKCWCSNKVEVEQKICELYQITPKTFRLRFAKLKKLKLASETRNRIQLHTGKSQCVTDYIHVDYNALHYILNHVKDLGQSTQIALGSCLVYSCLKNFSLRQDGEFKTSGFALARACNLSVSDVIAYLGVLKKIGVLFTTGIYKFQRDLSVDQKFTYSITMPQMQKKSVKKPSLTHPHMAIGASRLKKNDCGKLVHNFPRSVYKSSGRYFISRRRKTPQNFSNYKYLYREVFEKGGLSVVQSRIKCELEDNVSLNYTEYERLAAKFGKEKIWEMIRTYSLWKKKKNARCVSDFYELEKGWVLDRLNWEDQKILWERARITKEAKDLEYRLKEKFRKQGKCYYEEMGLKPKLRPFLKPAGYEANFIGYHGYR